MRWAVCLLAIVSNHLWACGCLVKFSLCQEVAASSTVFVGKVDSIYPFYLDSANRLKAAELLGEVSLVHRDPSPSSLERLKAIYSNMLGIVPDSAKANLERAASIEELDGVFDKIVAQGKQAFVSVRRNFRTPADDDKANDDVAIGATSQRVVVWSGVDDCGVDFQSGETYLIYASVDEQTGKLETSVCNRTRRLTDAAADLSYLFHVALGKDRNVRIDGRLAPPPRAPPDVPSADKLGSPEQMSGLVVSLSGETQRYARTGVEGDFIFEGLKRGSYILAVYAAGFPRKTVSLAEPVRIEAADKTCATTVIQLRPDWRERDESAPWH
jgi:hypothetical protein